MENKKDAALRRSHFALYLQFANRQKGQRKCYRLNKARFFHERIRPNERIKLEERIRLNERIRIKGLQRSLRRASGLALGQI